MSRLITADDFARIRLVSDPCISPDASAALFTLRQADLEKNKYGSSIWLAPLQEGEARCLTPGESASGGARWSPDGMQIAFTSDRQKPKSQIYLLPSDGGEARALTRIEQEGGVEALRWSPDGSRIAFLFRATPAGYRKEETEQRKRDEKSSPVRVHTRLNYRLDGAGYHDGEYRQVWVADVATGECRPLTSGPHECGAPVWSPDSQRLAFLSDRRDDRDVERPNTQIYTVAAAGGELALVPSPASSKGALSWAPDGLTLAYAGPVEEEDDWGPRNTRIWLLPVAGGEARDLLDGTDHSAGYDTLSDSHDAGAGDLIQWAADSQTLFFAISAWGDTRLFRARVGGGEPQPITPERGEMGGFSVSAAGDRVVYTFGTGSAPHEIFALTGAGASPVQRTRINSELLEGVRLSPQSPVQVSGPQGEIQGWICRPPEMSADRKYPLVLYVHGGPHLQYGAVFFHEIQYLAANGYVVLYVNPHGSSGRGEAYTRSIKGAWGSIDFEDVMAAADYGAALDYVDAARTAIMGGSYGGYMTAWAVGHTDRFRCAIADRLVGNLQSMSGTSDFTWRPDTYWPGSAWADPSTLWRCSPLAYAANITTPLLLIHSEGDLRCPIGQAEELFAALRMQRKTVELVRYPAESSHGLSRNGPPDLRLDRLQRNLAWLDKWLKE